MLPDELEVRANSKPCRAVILLPMCRCHIGNSEIGMSPPACMAGSHVHSGLSFSHGAHCAATSPEASSGGPCRLLDAVPTVNLGTKLGAAAATRARSFRRKAPR
jgi:hypothetical protein